MHRSRGIGGESTSRVHARERAGEFVREVAFMFDSIHRHIMAGYAVSIDFTKAGLAAVRQAERFPRNPLHPRLHPQAGRGGVHRRARGGGRASWTPSVRSCATTAASICCSGRFRAHGSSRTCSARKRPWPLRRCTSGRASGGAAVCMLDRLLIGWRSLTKALAERLVGA